MKTFKTWKVTFTAELVTTYPLDGAASQFIHEFLAEALRKNAGMGGYLVGNDETRIEETGDDGKV